MIDAQVTVTGNVTADPVFGQTNSGDPFTNFRVAVNYGYFDREKNQYLTSGTSFFKVSAFGALAVNTFESIQKGMPVVVHGRLRVEDWESGDKRGTNAVIKAFAIGPNLSFGQADFRSVKRPQLATKDPMTDVNVQAAHGQDADEREPDLDTYDEQDEASEAPVSLSA